MTSPTSTSDPSAGSGFDVLLIKLCGAAVFVAAVLVGVGLLFGRPSLYYAAFGLAAVAFLVVVLSAIPWRRRPPRYP